MPFIFTEADITADLFRLPAAGTVSGAQATPLIHTRKDKLCDGKWQHGIVTETTLDSCLLFMFYSICHY